MLTYFLWVPVYIKKEPLMQFNSIDFMIFFPVVLAVYFILPKQLRVYGLLAASYYFYMSLNAHYAILIGASTVVTYISGLIMSAAPCQKNGHSSPPINRKKITMAACIMVNLGILVRNLLMTAGLSKIIMD